MALIEGYPELNAYALGDDEPEDNEKDLDESNQELTEAEKALKEQRSLFALETQLQKTKLCRYHLKGLCKHGKECRFAHGAEELVEPPNLQKTRLCPMMLETGKCDNPQCTFAHREHELKKVNICHKTAMCTWFMAGVCRNGTECSFAHGEHELKGNAKNQYNSSQQKEPMFVHTVQSSMAQEALPHQAPVATVPPYMAPETNQFCEPGPYQVPQQQMLSVPPPLAPPLPSAGPPPPPIGFMPANFDYGMQPCVAGYSVPPQQDVLPMPLNYMSMQAPPPLMPQLPPVEVNGGGAPPPMMPQLPPPKINSGASGMSTSAMVAPPQGPPPGLTPQTPADNTYRLTELTVQISALSHEVKKLQDWIIPPPMQDMQSGSSMRTSDSNRTSPDSQAEETPGSGSDSDPRTFEEKVAGLQSELKRVIEEGQRCGKIRQAPMVPANGPHGPSSGSRGATP